MGMYSTHIDEEINIKDAQGFIKFLYEYPKTKDGNGYKKELDDAKMIFLDSGTFSLEFMDSWKIIQYWYNQTLKFFDELAKYIEGYVVFEYETGDEKAHVLFKDKVCTIDIYKREWNRESRYNTQDLMREEEV
jgi:hypothetical protein